MEKELLQTTWHQLLLLLLICVVMETNYSKDISLTVTIQSYIFINVFRGIFLQFLQHELQGMVTSGRNWKKLEEIEDMEETGKIGYNVGLKYYGL